MEREVAKPLAMLSAYLRGKRGKGVKRRGALLAEGGDTLHGVSHWIRGAVVPAGRGGRQLGQLGWEELGGGAVGGMGGAAVAHL
jgi:hypothetical protein